MLHSVRPLLVCSLQAMACFAANKAHPASSGPCLGGFLGFPLRQLREGLVAIS